MAEEPLNDEDFAYLRFVEFGELPPRVKPEEYVELVDHDARLEVTVDEVIYPAG